MGRISVDVELANYTDMAVAQRSLMPAEEIRRLTLQGVVDTGAASLVIPEDTAQRLGLQVTSKARVRYADGRRATRPIVQGVYLTYAGRSSVFDALVEPGRDTALIGAIVLEALDLIPDCRNQTLAPRDPRQMVFEIE